LSFRILGEMREAAAMEGEDHQEEDQHPRHHP
jgi:hypothetical protein